MWHFTSFFLKFKSNLLVKKSFLLVECCFSHGNPGFNSVCTSCIICYASQIVDILHFLQLFLIYHNLYWEWFPQDGGYILIKHKMSKELDIFE